MNFVRVYSLLCQGLDPETHTGEYLPVPVSEPADPIASTEELVAEFMERPEQGIAPLCKRLSITYDQIAVKKVRELYYRTMMQKEGTNKADVIATGADLQMEITPPERYQEWLRVSDKGKSVLAPVLQRLRGAADGSPLAVLFPWAGKNLKLTVDQDVYNGELRGLQEFDPQVNGDTHLAQVGSAVVKLRGKVVIDDTVETNLPAVYFPDSDVRKYLLSVLPDESPLLRQPGVVNTYMGLTKFFREWPDMRDIRGFLSTQMDGMTITPLDYLLMRASICWAILHELRICMPEKDRTALETMFKVYTRGVGTTRVFKDHEDKLVASMKRMGIDVETAMNDDWDCLLAKIIEKAAAYGNDNVQMYFVKMRAQHALVRSRSAQNEDDWVTCADAAAPGGNS